MPGRAAHERIVNGRWIARRQKTLPAVDTTVAGRGGPSPQPVSPSAVHARLFAPATGAAPPRVCVVAEIGVNHDSDLDRAVQLMGTVSLCGTDAVKLQLFEPCYLLSNQATLADYQKSNETDVFAMLDRLKLGVDDMRTVRAEVKRHGLSFIVMPFSLEDVRTLEVLDVDAVKIASPDAVNRSLLHRAVALDRPMIVSTGTATLDELTYVAERLRRHGAGRCLLECISKLPDAHDRNGPRRHDRDGAMFRTARRVFGPYGPASHGCARSRGRRLCCGETLDLRSDGFGPRLRCQLRSQPVRRLRPQNSSGRCDAWSARQEASRRGGSGAAALSPEHMCPARLGGWTRLD